MDLSFTPSEQAFRAEARAWLAANVPPGPYPSGDTREGYAWHVQWEKKLFAAGWSAVSWPAAYGGRDASLIAWLIFEEEYYRAGAPARVIQNGIFLLAPTLFEFGTEEQKERILRPMAAAEVHWAQAWSEPEAGSDLANVRSTAERVDGGWRVSGQKTWCTRGAFCDAIYGLFRTDPATERHRGLTYMMVDLHQPGVTVRPVERLDGDESFAEIFLDGAFVPDRDVIGQVHQGWKVAMATTSSERGLSLRSPGRFLATTTRLVDLYRRHPDPALRDRIADVWIQARAYQAYTYQTVTRMMAGGGIGADSSLNKLYWSELDLQTHTLALDLLGPQAELLADAPDAVDHAEWLLGFAFALAGPIYAGTNEVQRNIVAARVLDLPRG
ncbi:MAG: acyl-CoA dehydrogenase family protein [Alphaproteobacteria bacterium]|nr:acyl-CoA dehydrogenase family protein [Alphaproteobacteria bacterium]